MGLSSLCDHHCEIVMLPIAASDEIADFSGIRLSLPVSQRQTSPLEPNWQIVKTTSAKRDDAVSNSLY
jgi:hypothetical protein